MKVCILGDTHLGARGGSSVFNSYFSRFYTDIFFPYLKEHGIKTIFQLGDMFDKKRSIDFYTLDQSRKYFFDAARDNDIEVICNVGNHDIFYKSSCALNAPRLLTSEYDNVKIIDEPCEYVHSGTKLLILPWICQDNEQEVAELIDKTKAQIALGHLGLAGFCMYKGIPSHGGLSVSMFDKFEMVLTGHYHHRSTDGQIFYVGTPYELTWADHDDPRGFHILDLDNRQLDFISNPYTMFNKIIYDDSDKTFEEILDIDASRYRDTYVKIVVINKTNHHAFEAFVKHVENGGAVDVKVTENPVELILNDETEIEDVDDTATLLVKAVEETETTVDKDELSNLLVSLFNEASALESM